MSCHVMYASLHCCTHWQNPARNKRPNRPNTGIFPRATWQTQFEIPRNSPDTRINFCSYTIRPLPGRHLSMASPTLSTTVLGKRDTDTLVLHLSGSEEEQPPRKKLARSHSFPKQPLVINGRVASGGTRKRYRCTFGDCDKAYSKPCRLEEHERSHTGLVNGDSCRWSKP